MDFTALGTAAGLIGTAAYITIRELLPRIRNRNGKKNGEHAVIAPVQAQPPVVGMTDEQRKMALLEYEKILRNQNESLLSELRNFKETFREIVHDENEPIISELKEIKFATNETTKAIIEVLSRKRR